MKAWCILLHINSYTQAQKKIIYTWKQNGYPDMNVAKQPKTGTYNEDKAIYKYGQKKHSKAEFLFKSTT